MGHAYTPGLRVAKATTIDKKRLLPIKGNVLAKVGSKVKPEDIVAITNLAGSVETINIAGSLGLPAEDIKETLLKKAGDSVDEGEKIAELKSFMGLFKNDVKSPVKGTLESISEVTGTAIIRGEPIPVDVKAYIDGEVVEIIPNEGCIIRTEASFIQGIFGIGGETHGIITMVSKAPNEILDENLIKPEHKGKIIVGGSLVTAKALEKAINVGAAGVVVGGFDDQDLRKFLGFELGVAITGREELGITLIITEGFGKITMALKTFELLKLRNGSEASINGATQIRAGVIRPEVIIPIKGTDLKIKKMDATEEIGIAEGRQVRVIRSPHFGELGAVVTLPSDLQMMDSETHARVVTIKLESGEKITIPRANIEMIED
jgi:hypothetical protein